MSPIWVVLDWMYDHVPIVLVIWMAINASGLRDSFTLLVIGVRKRRTAMSRGLRLDGPRVLIANRGIREMALRSVFHATGLFIGGWVILGYPPAQTTGWLIVTMAFVMAVTSRFDIRDDRKLSQILDREIREHSIFRQTFPERPGNRAESPSGAQEGV